MLRINGIIYTITIHVESSKIDSCCCSLIRIKLNRIKVTCRQHYSERFLESYSVKDRTT